MRISGLDHVQLAIPVGGEADARSFYGDRLGLAEVHKPAQLAGRGGCWFVGPSLALHLGVEDPFSPARKAHPAFLVEDLAALRSELESAGIATSDDPAEIGVRRFYAEDPFGNRLEFVAADDAGFTERGVGGFGDE